MPRKRPQVLGVDLNCSESRRSRPRASLVLSWFQIKAPDERDVAGVIARVICAGTYDKFVPRLRPATRGLAQRAPAKKKPRIGAGL
jgi:hypothetical protein